MTRAERVELALGPLEKSGDPVLLPQGFHARIAPREELVRVPLMPDVPDQLVARRLEGIVERDGQLHDTQPRTDVPARARADVDHALAHVAGEGLQLLASQGPQIGGGIDPFENGHVRNLRGALNREAGDPAQGGGQQAHRFE